LNQAEFVCAFAKELGLQADSAACAKQRSIGELRRFRRNRFVRDHMFVVRASGVELARISGVETTGHKVWFTIAALL
jgi:hypothetical protein